MDDNVDVVIGHPKQIVCLNDLKALVHQRRRVHSNFATHAPVRVLQGICYFDCLQLFNRPVAERPSRCCQNDPAESVLRKALYALENG